MRRKSLLPLVMFALVLFAGDAEAQNRRFGIKGGLVMANFTSSTPLEIPLSSARSLGGGLSVELPLRGSVSVQAEALYLRRQTRTSFDGVEQRFVIDYLEVPLMLKIYGGDGSGRDSYRLYLLAGGSVALRLSADTELRVMDEVVETEDIKELIKPINIGLPIALGISFGRFDLEARYTIGLTAVDEVEARLKWRTWTFMAGINF